MNKKIIASFYNPKEVELPPYFRQTFKGEGNFKDIIFTSNNNEADFHIVGTWVDEIDNIKGKKIIYLQQEPPEVKLPNKNILDYSTLAISPFDIEHNVKQFIAPPVLQWTYDLNVEFKPGKGHVFSEIDKASKLEQLLFSDPPKKEKLCSIIVSKKSFLEGHRDRLNFTADLMDHFKDKIDFFGFGIKDLKNKKDAIDPYLFSIAIENSKHDNYWTEKIADVFLGNTMPIYHGCNNIYDFFPNNSLVNINIYDKDEAIAKIEDCLNNPNKFYNASVFDSRRRVILDYNMFKLLEVGIQQATH